MGTASETMRAIRIGMAILIPNEFDVFPDDPSETSDSDGDGVPTTRTIDSLVLSNPGQDDLDGDSLGDACDPDRDGDFVPNDFDVSPIDPSETSDSDADGIGDNADNSLGASNPGQEDMDQDGIGDVCDPDRLPTAPRMRHTCPDLANADQADTR